VFIVLAWYLRLGMLTRYLNRLWTGLKPVKGLGSRASRVGLALVLPGACVCGN
jgi:hypothetical protein